MGVPVDVLDEVVVVVEVLVRVLLGDELELRVGGRDRVPVRVILILGLPVEVADSVFVPGADLVTVGVPVDVLDGGEERVREGEPVVVFVPPIDFVADRVTGMVIDPLDVFVVQGEAVDVFDLAGEKLMLGDAEFDLDPRGVTESVGEEEDVFEDVPEGEDVFVEVIVFVEVDVPVVVRDPREEVVRREVALDVFERAELFVARGVDTGVRVSISDCVCSLEGKEDLVDVTVLVEVFD